MVKVVLAHPKTVNIILDKVLICHFMESNFNKMYEYQILHLLPEMSYSLWNVSKIECFVARYRLV